MKKWLLFVLTIAFQPVLHAQNLPEVLPILSGFDQAVERHSLKKVMKFIDADYKLDQHDKMLQGNTSQFINELLSGYSQPTDGDFIAIHYRDILQVDLYEMVDLYESNQVVWKILLTDGRIIYTTMWIKLNQKTGQYGIVGPVG
jgi:hypothetical protein